MFGQQGLITSIRRSLLLATLVLALSAGWAPPAGNPTAQADEPQGLDVTFVVVAGPGLATDQDELRDQVEDIGTAINLLHGLKWPATAADGKTPMGGAGQPIDRPAGVVVVGDLTGGYSYPGHEGACATEEPWPMTSIRQVFERGFANAGYNVAYPTYLGLGDRDLAPKGVDPECGRGLIWAYIDRLYAGGAGHAYSWDWGDLHLVQLHRFGGDTRAGLASSLGFLASDLEAAAGRPTILFQHYGWDEAVSQQACQRGDSGCVDDSGAPCAPGDPNCYRWWSDAERRALDEAIAGANVIAAFHGHAGGRATTSGHYTSRELGSGQIDIFNVWPSVVDGRARQQSARFAVVHVTDRYLDLAYVHVPAREGTRRPADPAAWLTLPRSYRFTTCRQQAPVLERGHRSTLTAIDEGATDPPGDRVDAIIPDGAITDPDGVPVKAIAVTGVDNSHGTWQYKSSADASWTAFGRPSEASARLLGPTARIRFLPNAGWSGEARLTFRAWDMGTGSPGGTADTRVNGGCSAFSAATGRASIAVRGVAPAVTPPGDQATHEGSEASFDLGSFADGTGDGPWTVQVEWGDSERSRFRMTAPGAIPAQPHTYADGPNTYTVAVTVTDKAGASGSATFQVTVRNVAPTLSDLSLSGEEDTALAIRPVDLAGHFADAGADRLQAVRIATLPAHGSLRLGADPVAAGQEISLRWRGDEPHFPAELAFVPEANWTGTTAFRWNGYDGHVWAADDATVTLTIGADGGVNDPPVNTVPAAFALDQGTARAGLAFGVADPDAGAEARLRFTLSAGHGTLTLASTAGLTIVAGANGSASMTCEGTLAAINAALGDVTYRPHPDYSGTDTITLLSDDCGHTGAGGAKTDEDTVKVKVRPVDQGADLALSIAAPAGPLAAGAELEYALTVRNNGPRQARGVTVSSTLPAGVSYDSATSSQGSCSQAGGTVTCSLGTLSSGASATISLRVRLGESAAGMLSNTATVTADTADPEPENNSATAKTAVTTISRLSPEERQAGRSAFTLTVHGANFAAGSTVLWNGSARTTTYISASELRAAIGADDIRHAGTAEVAVANPGGAGTTRSLTFSIRRAPTPTPVPAVIRLRVELAWGAGVDWGEIWTVVQWLDGAGIWHDVEGWQGGLEAGGRAWVVAPAEYGKAPFRWALTRGRGGELLAVSDSFRLPEGPGQTVERLVRVLAPAPTSTPTAAPSTPTAVPPTAGPGATQPAPTATATSAPVATTTPPATHQPWATATPQLWPTRQPAPTATPTPEPPGPRDSLLLSAAVALTGLLIIGIVAGWLWQRGLRR